MRGVNLTMDSSACLYISSALFLLCWRVLEIMRGFSRTKYFLILKTVQWKGLGDMNNQTSPSTSILKHVDIASPFLLVSLFSPNKVYSFKEDKTYCRQREYIFGSFLVNIGSFEWKEIFWVEFLGYMIHKIKDHHIIMKLCTFRLQLMDKIVYCYLCKLCNKLCKSYHYRQYTGKLLT